MYKKSISIDLDGPTSVIAGGYYYYSADIGGTPDGLSWQKSTNGGAGYSGIGECNEWGMRNWCGYTVPLEQSDFIIQGVVWQYSPSEVTSDQVEVSVTQPYATIAPVLDVPANTYCHFYVDTNLPEAWSITGVWKKNGSVLSGAHGADAGYIHTGTSNFTLEATITNELGFSLTTPLATINVGTASSCPW